MKRKSSIAKGTDRMKQRADEGRAGSSREVTSALATVGLSRGLTPDVSEKGRIILEVAMIFGRLGPLALVLAMASISPLASRGERPTGRVMLG